MLVLFYFPVVNKFLIYALNHVYLEGEIDGEVENNEDAIELNENNGDSGDSEDSEDCLDGDYDLGREEVDAENNRIDEDDDLFNNHVDGEESEEARGGDEEGSEEDLSENSEGFSDSDNFDNDKASDDENGPKYPSFNSIDTYNPQFQLGMLFSSKKEFKTAVQLLAVRTRRNIKFAKNDKRRVYAKCAEEDCDFRIHALVLGNQQTFQIREYHSIHKCGVNFHVKNCKSTWLGEKYEDLFRTYPRRAVKGFKQDAIKDMRVHFSRNQAYRAKWKALKKIEGSSEEQHGRLRDYVEELRRSNSGSTVILSSDLDDFTRVSKFGKFYVCFNGLKQGFLSGCRPIVGVDGCHLKGPHGGVLLTAVGIDPNNACYPIAFAVVSVENRDAWEWFLRFCVRHLHGNMKRAGFTGLAYKKALWMAARATTTAEFDVMMKKICKLDIKLGEWMNDKPPSQWSRSHFNPYPKCDILLNNLCESFNASILEAREKQIYSMLEWIREFLMTRLQQNRDRAASRCAVDLQRHTCSCRRWDLSGIPCKHAMSAINSQRLDAEDFIAECYSVATYLRVYQPCIMPVNGPEKWQHTDLPPLLPPNIARGVGRPARARRLEPDEVPLKHKGIKGYNKKGCQKRKDAEAAEIERAVQEAETLFSVNVETQVSIDLSSQARKRTIIPTRSSTQITLQPGKKPKAIPTTEGQDIQ
ncbi:UNVERIFIED_CONTAM: hypothetical protein Scaly_2235100 [Sesamum calycinum]|uniref:SWIM-type domain-containing protein n=1 Tax=Sesamum calycinum TaxID=2727403 RepID=A0AAW2M986_9LAMI